MAGTTVVGIFEERAAARQAVVELQRAGFLASEIGLVMQHDTGPVEPDIHEEPREGQGAVAGALAGGALGTALGLAAGLLPGVGPIIAGGVLAAALFGAGAGAVAGGLAGTLIGMGVPEDEIPYYRQAFEEGRILVTVRTQDRRAEAMSILDECGGLTGERISALMRPQG